MHVWASPISQQHFRPMGMEYVRLPHICGHDVVVLLNLARVFDRWHVAQLVVHIGH